MQQETTKGFCGLACNECPAFIAHRTNDQKLREQTAKEWSQKFNFEFSSEMINCTGCQAKKGPQIGHCSECTLRLCGLKKKVKGCASCNTFSTCNTCAEFEKVSGLNLKELNFPKKTKGHPFLGR